MHATARWIAWGSLVLVLSAIGLAAGRTVRNAVALGGGAGTAEARSRLARSIWRDHLYCLAAMAGVAALQLGAGLL